jgi:hypothetical protein
MNKDYMNKLINDIQQYLREEGQKERKQWHFLPTKASLVKKEPLPRPVFIGLITLLSACAIGSITVAILLLGFVGTPLHDSTGAIWLLGAGGCGIFFSAMLVSVWKRLALLSQIERNTRLILASRRKTNALLEQFMRNMS